FFQSANEGAAHAAPFAVDHSDGLHMVSPLAVCFSIPQRGKNGKGEHHKKSLSKFPLPKKDGREYHRTERKGGVFVQANILVVDDEKEIADLVQVYLENEGFTVYKCYTGKE